MPHLQVTGQSHSRELFTYNWATSYIQSSASTRKYSTLQTECYSLTNPHVITEGTLATGMITNWLSENAWVTSAAVLIKKKIIFITGIVYGTLCDIGCIASSLHSVSESGTTQREIRISAPTLAVNM